MSKLKHTPGPWSASNDRVFSAYGQSSGDGHALNESEKWVIADLIGSGSYGGFEFVELGDDDRQANAKLIAAAPELYRALERIARPHDCGCVPCTGSCVSEMALQITVDEIRQLARDAIQKATA